MAKLECPICGSRKFRDDKAERVYVCKGCGHRIPHDGD